MATLRLTFACGPFDRTQALHDGTVKLDGIELIYLSLQPAEIFWRMLQFNEFHISEMSRRPAGLPYRRPPMIRTGAPLE
jgi:4,5-dihydroxyphthalate decarboxylase